MFSLFQNAEAMQAELETNIFEAEKGIHSEDTAKGQEMILEFLRKCKEIEKNISDNNVLVKKVDELKQELLKHGNKYVQSIVAMC